MTRLWSFIILFAKVCLGLAGLAMLPLACAPPPTATLGTPDLARSERLQRWARTDIEYLDGPEAEGRQTATRGFARAAVYVADQMRQVQLQPVLVGEYRMQYAALLRRSAGVSVQLIGSDTTNALHGDDFLITGAPRELHMAGVMPSLPDVDWLQWSEDMYESRGSTSRWSVDISVDERVSTAPMHVVGMLPGSHPVRRDSVVLVLAPLDGDGMKGSESWTDGSDLSLPAAALLHTMRQMAEYQHTWALYTHSTLFGLLSGTRDDCQGPSQFIRHLPWERSRVSTVIVVSMQVDWACDWNALLRDSFSENSGPEVVLLQAYAPYGSLGATEFGSWRRRASLMQSDVLDEATTEVLRLARRLLEHVP